MKIEELCYEDKVNKEVFEGLKDIEELVAKGVDKETILFKIKKMKMKYDGIPF